MWDQIISVVVGVLGYFGIAGVRDVVKGRINARDAIMVSIEQGARAYVAHLCAKNVMTSEQIFGEWRSRVCDLAKKAGLPLAEKDIQRLASRASTALHMLALNEAAEARSRVHEVAKAIA